MVESRTAQQERMRREIAAARERQARLLAREYAQTAERLREAYRGSLPAIEQLIAQLIAQPAGAITVEDMQALAEKIARELGILEQAISEAAAGMQATGARAGISAGIANLQAAGMGTRFGVTAIDQIIAAIDYVDNPVFRLKVGNLGLYHGQQVADIIIAAMAQGRNPRETAALIAQYLNISMRPLQDALRMARTTQIYSARKGTQAIYQRSGIQYWVWSSALDSRTCLACIVMHGTIHPVSELLNDHHNGRCAMAPVTATFGGETENGADWFALQSAEFQRQAMGPQLWEAWQAGQFNLDEATVVGTYNNDLFGEMRRRRTNAEIFGN